MFSTRVPDLSPNALSLAVAARRARGASFIDLTTSNPTAVGIEYPHGVLDALTDPRALRYEPQPFGPAPAREAVARQQARGARPVAADRVVLTASSSESYALLFKTFCDPGDVVLVPAPSYPLFEHLAVLEGVRTRPYRLEYHETWSIDFSTIDAHLDDRTRAVIVVTPNNPTGSCLRRYDLERLAAICSARSLPLISDEVFADYPVAPAGDAVPGVTGTPGVLTVALGGLSKSAGLPQLKLGWMIVDGPAEMVSGTLARLEHVCDAYLSVSTPVQVAAGALLAAGHAVRRQIADHILLNYGTLIGGARGATSCRVLPVEAGWSAVVQLPATMTDEARALQLLDAGVLVHPGYLFDFEREGFIVISLLPPAALFRQGVSTLFEVVEPGSAAP